MTFAADQHFRTLFNAFADVRLHPIILLLCHHRSDGGLLISRIANWKGGHGLYLLKTLLDKELLETVRAVHAGKKVLSAEASYELAEHATSDALTPAEIDVLRLIAAGHANKEIAHQLSTTEDSVKGRVKSILSKLGATDRTHAAMIGVKRGIIQS
jgi:DNA-binding NarL/FixJ family response regulator